MSRVGTPGDGPKCVQCGKPAVWSGWCQMEDGKGFCNSQNTDECNCLSSPNMMYGPCEACSRQREERKMASENESLKVGDEVTIDGFMHFGRLPKIACVHPDYKDCFVLDDGPISSIVNKSMLKKRRRCGKLL